MAKRKTCSKRKSTTKRTGRRGVKHAGMAHKGSKCKRFKVVHSKLLGKKVRRCAQY